METVSHDEKDLHKDGARKGRSTLRVSHPLFVFLRRMPPFFMFFLNIPLELGLQMETVKISQPSYLGPIERSKSSPSPSQIIDTVLNVNAAISHLTNILKACRTIATEHSREAYHKRPNSPTQDGNVRHGRGSLAL